jgi:hypothetical protein
MIKYQKIFSAFRSLHEYLVANEYKGYEFDDFLSSKLVNFITLNNLFLKRLAIQTGRCSIINLRKIIGVKKLESSKAFGFFVKGYLYHYLASEEKKYLEVAGKLLKWLEANYCADFSGMSWGNAFDFASRGGFIPRGLPTIVWTSHISESFDFAYSITKTERYRDNVLKIGTFILENLKRFEDDTGVCLGYVPGSTSVIHNSNLLGAIALLRAWRYSKNAIYLDLAKKAIDWSCSRINPDGSWYYGESETFKWIDNFHTAYNLDSLIAAQDIAGPGIVKQQVIDSTYKYWIDNLFLADGAPKYYHNRTYPIDIQCASQAIESLAKYSDRNQEAINLALRIANWTIDNMQKKNGAFYLRIGRVVKNGLESIHWGQSTMLSALGCLSWYIRKSKTDIIQYE